MDWYLDATDPRSVSSLRHELTAYLERHAMPGEDIDGAVLTFDEVAGNVVKHAPGPAWVSLDWSEEKPLLSVNDLGPGLTIDLLTPPPQSATHGRGLLIAAHLTDRLEAAAKAAGGARVQAVLNVRRRREDDYDPVVTAVDVLPAPEEARDDGTFSKESFLRALVVQLSRTVEMQDGPGRAESVVAQVGTDIGFRMEEAYRKANAVTGTLTATQMGELFVQLKAAIDGDFYVVSADDEKIVLGNRRCPFGDAVKKSPSLCRMTSSVFGGVAARNAGPAAVHLEERIAVGDPECRVTVWLREPEGSSGHGHRYAKRPPL